jgi:regulator of PEP synthase PpsR (kinase-PPPase family)
VFTKEPVVGLTFDDGRIRSTRWIRKLALRSESPLTSLQELCTEVREATSDARRWRVRQTVAKSWAELASSLAVHPARQQEAAYAAIHAVVLAPSLLV